MRDLPDLVLAAVLMFVIAWWAAADEEERHIPISKEVMNGYIKTQPLWQTEVKPTPATRLLDSEGLGDERPRTR